ncbi:MAG: type III pantothenate kinase, partial [Gammaproteobacteria bacterium]
MTDLKLLVDIGNSRIKWAFGTSAHFVAQGDVPHAAGGLGDLLDSALRPGEIRIANVAGIGAGDRVAAVLRERFGFRAVFAAAAARGAGVHNGYTDPTQLGVDRWLAICAAFARFGGP